MTSKVLVVDDDEAIRVLVTRLFAKRGFDVTSAMDGADAIACLNRDHYDLVLLDLMMPKTDGVAVANHIVATSNGHRPRIIVMSAAVPAVLERLPHDSIWKTITKPFRVEALMKEAEEALADGGGG